MWLPWLLLLPSPYVFWYPNISNSQCFNPEGPADRNKHNVRSDFPEKLRDRSEHLHRGFVLNIALKLTAVAEETKIFSTI